MLFRGVGLGAVAVELAAGTGYGRLMSTFVEGEHNWIVRLGNLRNTVRQEVMRRQLAGHVTAGMTVLDVGCGQGTQAVELAKLGCVVTGVEPSPELRRLCVTAAQEVGVTVKVIDGTIENLAQLITDDSFDLVCAHGLLMYLPDRTLALRQLARFVRPGGDLSITFRNGHALAMRPGLRQDWSAALSAFGSRGYVNELGVVAEAHLLDEVTADLAELGLDLVAWYGVRVFTDWVDSSMPPPTGDDLQELFNAEDRAGRLDPYRWMASMLHVVVHAPAATT